jgi:pyruvate dehydrogenase E2 component (dihydrolipoamide acetyltransferase)
VKKYDLFGYIDRAPYDGMRKTIGDHMVKSVFTAPHVTHMDTVEVTNLWALREREKAAAKKQGIKLTFLAYILKATVEALMKHPFLNAMLDEQNSEIILKKYYNIGVAVDTEAGLMVPVLKGADKKEVTQIAKEIVDLAEKARSRKINPMDLKGGTFTITNVGSAGSGKFFTPVINFPEAAILGIGLIEDAPVAVDGKVAIRKILYLSLSFDHRILDGAEAARFVKDLKDLLQAYGAPATTAKDASPEPSGLKKKTPAKRLIAM